MLFLQRNIAKIYVGKNSKFVKIRKSRPWGLQFESDKEEEKENAGDVLEFLADKRLSKFANEVTVCPGY